MIVVVDTSIALQWVLPEAETARAEMLLTGHELVAPDVLLVEAANVLAKKVRAGQIPVIQATESIEFLTANVRRLVPVPALITRALEISIAISHPVYDCMYLACAERLGARVATRDAPFAKRVIERGMGHLLETAL